MLELPADMQSQGSQVSEHTQRRIDNAIRDIVMRGFSRASAILGANRPVLEQGARALLRQGNAGRGSHSRLGCRSAPGRTRVKNAQFRGAATTGSLNLFDQQHRDG